MEKEIADKILLETETGYDSISQKFSQTRKHFWRGLEYIKNYTRQGDKVLDFGCGNGRLLELIGARRNIQYYGLDVSQGLVDLASGKYKGQNIHFTKINPSQTSLAFEDNFFNTTYSIAVFHHFPSQSYREDVANEIYNKTSDSGHVIVTVWYLWPASLRQVVVPASRGGQKKYFKNIIKNWIKKIKGESQLDWNDCLISFTDNQGQKFNRFHHAFTKQELKNLFSNAGFTIEKCEVVNGRNILLVGKKIGMSLL